MSPAIPLGAVLVVGGSGFLGHHIIKELLAEPSCNSISVMSRDSAGHMFKNVAYYTGDVTNILDVERVLTLVKPNVIFNTASPIAYLDYEPAKANFPVNIEGNKYLLAAARLIGTTRAYVYTSSAPIVAKAGSMYDHANETFETLAFSKKGDAYHVAKAIGDKLVLEANDDGKHGMRTACIRPTAMYGQGDRQMIGPVLNVLKNRQTNIWMGYNDVEMDVVYVVNVAKAEILAAKGLLAGITDPNAPKVDGEAFNITDGKPLPPWTFFRIIWRAAGDTTPLSSVWMIPPWLALFIIAIAEWWIWLVSFGKRRPKTLVKERIEFSLYTRTYDIRKAQERLGYRPLVDQTGVIKSAVDFHLGHPPLGKKLM